MHGTWLVECPVCSCLGLSAIFFSWVSGYDTGRTFCIWSRIPLRYHVCGHHCPLNLYLQCLIYSGYYDGVFRFSSLCHLSFLTAKTKLKMSFFEICCPRNSFSILLFLNYGASMKTQELWADLPRYFTILMSRNSHCPMYLGGNNMTLWFIIRKIFYWSWTKT